MLVQYLRHWPSIKTTFSVSHKSQFNISVMIRCLCNLRMLPVTTHQWRWYAATFKSYHDNRGQRGHRAWVTKTICPGDMNEWSLDNSSDKHNTLTQCCSNVDPVSATLAHHLHNTGLNLVLLNCAFLFFIYLQLKLLTQFPASNEENRLIPHKFIQFWWIDCLPAAFLWIPVLF